MSELLAAVLSWRTLLLVVLVFGFAPGFCLRLLVKVYPKDDPRRRELMADLYTLGHFERLLYVGEQLETVLFEGVPHRIHAIRVKLASKKNSELVSKKMSQAINGASDVAATVSLITALLSLWQAGGGSIIIWVASGLVGAILLWVWIRRRRRIMRYRTRALLLNSLARRTDEDR